MDNALRLVTLALTESPDQFGAGIGVEMKRRKMSYRKLGQASRVDIARINRLVNRGVDVDGAARVRLLQAVFEE